MTLEQQVISLELAKKLKELNVPQESLFYWVEIQGKGKTVLSYREEDMFVPPNLSISAYTVAELGEMLPKAIIDERFGNPLQVHFFKNAVQILDTDEWKIVYEQHADTEADARAKMLIHLIENDLYVPLSNKTVG